MDEYDDRFQDVSDLFQGLGQVVRYIVFGYFKMLGDLFVGKVLLPAHLKIFRRIDDMFFTVSSISSSLS